MVSHFPTILNINRLFLKLMPWSHQTFGPVLAVKLLATMCKITCWPTTFHIITAGDADGWCQTWLVWSTPQPISSVTNVSVPPIHCCSCYICAISDIHTKCPSTYNLRPCYSLPVQSCIDIFHILNKKKTSRRTWWQHHNECAQLLL